MAATAARTSEYLDGASAETAFQGLIDKGLFADAPKPEAPAASTEAAPAETPVVAEKPQATPPAAESKATPEAEEYTSLDEYLTKSGLEREAFLSLPVQIKVDGQESQVPLASLLKSYQTDAHVQLKSQQLSEKQKQWEAEQTNTRVQLQQGLTLANQLATLAHQELMREYQDVTPADPARYLEAQQRLGAIQQHLLQVQQAQQQVGNANVAAEQAKMLDAVPEWRDPTKFQEASKQLASYAATRGFTPAELSGVADHRYMLVLHDAARARDLQAQVDTLKAQLEGKTNAALKLVRAAPPMASPGARITRDPKSARIQQVRELGKSGKLARNEDAQLAAFSALADAGA